VSASGLFFPSHSEPFSSLGRKRVGSLEAADDNVEELIEDVRKRGQFKTRLPEGKAGGDH
jgi:hypothetical protein